MLHAFQEGKCKGIMINFIVTDLSFGKLRFLMFLMMRVVELSISDHAVYIIHVAINMVMLIMLFVS